MKEDFLHYLWKNQLLNEPLVLESEGNIEIIHPGEHNTDAGPDFFNSKIKIDTTLWAGNVEMHLKASDWFKHKHQNDSHYDNIILHVVAENDQPIYRADGSPIPTLVLKIPKNLYEHYVFLMQNKDWVPCESFISKVDAFTILQWKEALLVERLAEKAQLIEERFKSNNNNWEETFYQTLASNFGFKTNAQPFEMLAKSLPLVYLGKHKDNLSLVEAMLFGQAGLLPTASSEPYHKQLISDYNHLSNKFNLQPLSGDLWKFMRLRPSNFPSVRLAQFASLIHKSSSLFSKILEAKTVLDIFNLFDVKASTYWDEHYTFNSTSAKKEKHLGDMAVQNILINTIAPTLYFYGRQKGQQKYIDLALDWLIELPSENNKIVRNWLSLGLESENAFDSQALIQLKNVYCKYRKCLNCRIGNKVIKHAY